MVNHSILFSEPLMNLVRYVRGPTEQAPWAFGRAPQAERLTDMLLVGHHFAYKFAQRLGRRIISDSEIIIQLVVIRLLGAKEGVGDARLFQHGAEALRLDAGVGMIVHIQDQEGRDALAAGDVRHGGEVFLLFGRVAKFDSVALFWGRE